MLLWDPLSTNFNWICIFNKPKKIKPFFTTQPFEFSMNIFILFIFNNIFRPSSLWPPIWTWMNCFVLPPKYFFHTHQKWLTGSGTSRPVNFLSTLRQSFIISLSLSFSMSITPWPPTQQSRVFFGPGLTMSKPETYLVQWQLL